MVSKVYTIHCFTPYKRVEQYSTWLQARYVLKLSCEPCTDQGPSESQLEVSWMSEPTAFPSVFNVSSKITSYPSSCIALHCTVLQLSIQLKSR